MFRMTKFRFYIYLVVGVTNVVSEQIQLTKFVHDPNFDNKIPTNTTDVIKTPTMLDCAYLCHSNANFVAYYFTFRSFDCQFMNEDINSNTYWNTSEGTKYFYKKSIRSSMRSSTDPAIMTSSSGTKSLNSPSMTSTGRTISLLERTTSKSVPQAIISCEAICNGWLLLHYPDGSNFSYRSFIDQHRTHSEAKKLCERNNATLPVFMTTGKQDYFIQQILRPCEKYRRFWAGGDNTKNVDRFSTWNNQSIRQTTTLWRQDTVHSTKEVHCIQMASEFNFKFDYTHCTNRNIYTICEK